jgi:hypothetical protein
MNNYSMGFSHREGFFNGVFSCPCADSFQRFHPLGRVVGEEKHLLTLPTCAFGVTGNSVVSCYTPADPSSNSETP